jgi:hypothetical protein
VLYEALKPLQADIKVIGALVRLPRGKRQDIGLAFGHTIRRHAKTLLGDHDHAA